MHGVADYITNRSEAFIKLSPDTKYEMKAIKLLSADGRVPLVIKV